MASGGGLLPTYQQQKYINGVPLSTVGRRTLRLREKYILLVVVSVFAFVCFGAIFFMPDMRDRVASADGHIGPVDIGDIFVPRLPAGSNQNRHGRGNLRDPHDLNDERIFRDRVQQAPNQAFRQWPRPPSIASSLADGHVDSDRTAKQRNETVKDGRLINIPLNASRMDNTTRERQETVRQVVLLLLKAFMLAICSFCIMYCILGNVGTHDLKHKDRNIINNTYMTRCYDASRRSDLISKQSREYFILISVSSVTVLILLIALHLLS